MGVVYKAVLFLVLVAVTFRATATATLFNDCGGQGFDLYFLVDVGGVFRDLPGVSTLIERTMSTFIVNSTNVQVGVWLYGEVVSRSIDMNETTSANLPSKLAGLPRLRTRSRNLQTALRQIGTRMFGEADGDRPDMPNVVVLLTDSVSRAPSLTPGLVDEIYTVHGKIVNFAVVAQGASYDMRELYPIACKPNHIFQTDLPLTELINNGNALFFVRYIMCNALTEPGCYPPPVVTILPVNPRCRATIAASQERGFQAVDIVCQTEENFPEAVCEFYRVTDGGNPVAIQAEITYNHTQGANEGSLTSQCMIQVPVQDLGVGSHMFHAMIYLNVTDGRDMVNETEADGVIEISLPVVKHECPENWIQDYLCGIPVTCNCTLESPGSPRGAAYWFDSEGVYVGDGGLEFTYNPDVTELHYVCGGKSALGRNFGSSLKIKTECGSGGPA